MHQAEGGTRQIGLQAVVEEVTRGSEGNARVEELLHDGARPLDTSTLEYIQMWLTSVQVARAVNLPQEDRDRRGRQIMFQWLARGNSRRR